MRSQHRRARCSAPPLAWACRGGGLLDALPGITPGPPGLRGDLYRPQLRPQLVELGRQGLLGSCVLVLGCTMLGLGDL